MTRLLRDESEEAQRDTRQCAVCRKRFPRARLYMVERQIAGGPHGAVVARYFYCERCAPRVFPVREIVAYLQEAP